MATPNVVLPESFHETAVIREVPLDVLQVDKSYQRDPSPSLVDRIANDWDSIASELATVSNRGERDKESGIKGGLFLVNGQHRALAARKIGRKTIWARVVDLSNEPDPGAIEAGLRLKTNVGLPDRPLERFKAQLRNGDEDSMEIVAILKQFDTRINEVPDAHGGINCVSAIEQIYRADLLYDTMALLKDTFEQLGGRVVSADLMKAVAWFIEKHSFEADRYRVIEKMKSTGLAGLHAKASQTRSILGGSLWMNYYKTILEIYNEKLADKNKLQWQLRGSAKLGKTKATVTWQ